MQVILYQSYFIPQKDKFGIGVQLFLLSYVSGEWIQSVDSRFGQCKCCNCLVGTCKKYRFKLPPGS